MKETDRGLSNRLICGRWQGRGPADDFGEGVTIALVGNPNVGKTTLFNALTGMSQHTGNWPGKTVATAEGDYTFGGNAYHVTDLPGTYSLFPHSPEEVVARDYILHGKGGRLPDICVVVCDAGCLERNMGLVLQTLEISSHTLVCVNLIDEAKRRGVSPNIDIISKRLGVPVIGISAKRRADVTRTAAAVHDLARSAVLTRARECDSSLPAALPAERVVPPPVIYQPEIERAAKILAETPLLRSRFGSGARARAAGLELLQRGIGSDVLSELAGVTHRTDGGTVGLGDDECTFTDFELETLAAAYAVAWQVLRGEDGEGAPASACRGEIHDRDSLGDSVAIAVMERADDICRGAIEKTKGGGGYGERDRRIDKLLTGRLVGYPMMLLFLFAVLWLTIKGANYPSEFLARGFAAAEAWLYRSFISIGVPGIVTDALIGGAFRVLGWVVSVMLPPMAIFFPLFTLLEDAGYLPRIAYALDRPFACAHACGKQALTMCMGLGCNAAGVVGCRIIDSPRERLLAILTNALMPCNGRFPAIITAITLFVAVGRGSSVLAALILAAFMILCVLVTFAVTFILSRTLLRGEASAFTLEMPPYRRPDVCRVLVRSLLDRTLFVLGRAAAVAAPAGLAIWLLANVKLGGVSILQTLALWLDAPGRLIGLDGAVLLGFILGLPANEIVLPITVMVYLAAGSLPELGGGEVLRTVLANNGWCARRAVCFVIFMLFHWPCSTTLLTIKKETVSRGGMVVSAILPAIVGALLAFLVNSVWSIFA